jgi:hypothetical protein
MRRALIGLGLLVLVFGVFCLNYTAVGKTEHHAEWAREKGLPEPRGDIFVLGVACTAFGAGAFGFGLGRRRS